MLIDSQKLKNEIIKYKDFIDSIKAPIPNREGILQGLIVALNKIKDIEELTESKNRV